jgi:hypothetical protein
MKTKSLLLVIALLIGALSLKGQEKIQYAVIQFNFLLKKEIQISVDGKEYFEEAADYSPGEKASYNVNPLLKKVSKYENEGWELISFQTFSVASGGYPVYVAYMKKKKQEAESK